MNGPELWDQILDQMPPGSVIAGGAVRDYLLGVAPKDIDVFMGEVVTDAFDARAGLYRIDNVYERQAEYAAMSDINLVSTGEMFGHRVDAVVMDNYSGGAKLVEGFDFGLTRCWYDGEIHQTRQSIIDRENMTVTLLLTDRRKRALARFARFNDRMGGRWTFVEPTCAVP